MAGTTYSKFFWQDWQGDPELKICTLAAQGWWMRLLCVAGTANSRGRVTVAARKPSPDDMRSITGCLKVTDEEMALWEAELVRNKVCDVDPDGVLVSRRQRRQADKLHPQAAGGRARAKTAARTGGRFAPAADQHGHQHTTPANASNAGGKNYNRNNGVQPAHQHAQPATINHQPLTISHQPPKTPPTREENIQRTARVSVALGFDLTTARNGHRYIEDLIRLQADGFDFELDILPTMEERRQSGGIPRDLGSLAYFRKGFEAKRAGRQVTEAAQQQRAAAPVEDTDPQGWKGRLDNWLGSGYWPPRFGPRPLNPGCMATGWLLEQAAKVWGAQGGHPQGAFPADPNGRFMLWKDLKDLRDDADVDYGNRALNVVAIPRRA